MTEHSKINCGSQPLATLRVKLRPKTLVIIILSGADAEKINGSCPGKCPF